MAEYIERETLIKQVMANFRQASWYGCDNPLYSIVEETILEAPASDVVSVVHGRWVPEGDGYWHCSECGRRVYSPKFSPSFIHQEDNKQYCPSCGAKIDL